eukprot:1526738-Amphidinium_carterae.1
MALRVLIFRPAGPAIMHLTVSSSEWILQNFRNAVYRGRRNRKGKDLGQAVPSTTECLWTSCPLEGRMARRMPNLSHGSDHQHGLEVRMPLKLFHQGAHWHKWHFDSPSADTKRDAKRVRRKDLLKGKKLHRRPLSPDSSQKSPVIVESSAPAGQLNRLSSRWKMKQCHRCKEALYHYHGDNDVDVQDVEELMLAPPPGPPSAVVTIDSGEGFAVDFFQMSQLQKDHCSTIYHCAI